MEKTILGKIGEEIARNYLIKKGYKILQSNYRSRQGEIDLICRDGETIVFVEVKTRTSEKFGSPQEAVTSRKQKHIQRAAMEYLITHNLESQPARFDVLSLLIGIPPTETEIEHIIGAF